MVTGDEKISPLLLHRYRVEAQWDEGDALTALRAYDTQRQRHVVIRTLRPDALRDDAGAARILRARFANEAEAGARIGPRDEIVAVFDLVSGADDAPYLILEYLPGGTLAERLRHGVALPLTEAVAITRDVACALQTAHDAGIVHGDVRPANIYLTATEHAKLGGFGYAQIAGSARAALPAPVPSPSSDAARYLAPEQEQEQERAGDVQPATDQYHLGLIFFEMLMGVAFRTLAPADAWARAAWQSPAVFACLRRMTMDTPAERYPSMAAVIAALDRIALPLPLTTDALPVVAPALALPPEPPPTSPAPLPSVASPLAPLPAESPIAAVKTHALPRYTAPLPVIAEPAPADHPRRAPFARIGGVLLILFLLVGAFFAARGAGFVTRSHPAATASITSAETVAPFAPTPSVIIVALAPLTPTALMGAATATPRPVSPAPSAGASGSTATTPRSTTAPSPGITAQATPAGATNTVPAASRAPAATATPAPPASPPQVAPMPTLAQPTSPPAAMPTMPASPPQVAPVPIPTQSTPLTPTPLAPMPTATPLPTPVPPTATPLPPMLGVQSVGTTNQALTTVSPEDSVTQFAAGQEIFGWVNFGGAAVGQDSFDAAVIASGAVIETRQAPLTQPEGFAVFSLGPLPAGQYTLQVSYRGNVVRESNFTVGVPVGQSTVPPRIVPTLAPRVAPAVALPDAMPPVPQPTTPPVVAAPLPTTAPVIVVPPPTAPPVVVTPPLPLPIILTPMPTTVTRGD